MGPMTWDEKELATGAKGLCTAGSVVVSAFGQTCSQRRAGVRSEPVRVRQRWS